MLYFKPHLEPSPLSSSSSFENSMFSVSKKLREARFHYSNKLLVHARSEDRDYVYRLETEERILPDVRHSV